MSKREKPYVISQDVKGGFWYCHKRGYTYVPVFGSIGDKHQGTESMRYGEQECGI